MPQVATCPKCRKAIHDAQSESWCLSCGTPFSQDITSVMPRLVETRAAAALELELRQPSSPTRGERIFRGMVGMGTVFGLVGGVIIATLVAGSLLFSPETHDRDELEFMFVATFVWFGIAFGLGMLYAGLLAWLARGRSFRELSIARVAAAGAMIGLVPAVVVMVGGTGWSIAEVTDPLIIFPPLSTTVAVTTLLIARRAQRETASEEPPVEDR